jgi:hypothetical protein
MISIRFFVGFPDLRAPNETIWQESLRDRPEPRTFNKRWGGGWLIGCMRRTSIGVSLCLALLAAPAGAHATPRQVRVAIKRAKRDMREVSLPPGSRLVAAYPADGHEPMRPQPKVVGSHTVERRQLWRVPRSPGDVFRRVESHSGESFHRPHEQLCGSFFGGEAVCPSPARVASEPGGRGILGARTTVSATPLPGGRSRVEVIVVTTWVEPRSPRERVPDGAKRIELEVERAGEVRSLPIADRRQVDGIVALVDRLRVDQFDAVREEILPEVGAPPPSRIRLLFESRSGRVLARTVEREGEEVVRFAVGGRQMAPLERGGRLLRALIPERRRAR